MRFERVVKQVFDMLQEVRLGTVVAVWSDGGVSAHRDLGFRYRTLPSDTDALGPGLFVATARTPGGSQAVPHGKMGVEN